MQAHRQTLILAPMLAFMAWLQPQNAHADEQPQPPPADPQTVEAQNPSEPAQLQGPLRVTATDIRAPKAASAQTVTGEELKLRPRLRAADILEAIPGLFAAQHAGGGKANQYFLRGFDLDHGTDIALYVDGMPVNMVSHGHGQGYADMHFVIPELVSSLEAYKGTYEARYGDFTTAGAVELNLADHLEESQSPIMVGRFGIVRGLAISSLEVGERLRVLMAGEVYAQDGPFERREDLSRINGLARMSYDLSDTAKATLTFMSHAGTWNASGQIPEREVKAGRLGHFGYIDPSEGGAGQRHSVNLALQSLDENAVFQANVYFIRHLFRLYSDFTFFLKDPEHGDMIEQTDDRYILGGQFNARYHHHLGPVRLEANFGVQARFDAIDNGLYHDFQRERLSATGLSSISQTGVALFAEEEARYRDWVKFTLGVRLDHVGVSVEDRLDNTDILGNNRTGSKSSRRISPKAALVFTPLPWMNLFLDFGRGFHSNDARGAVRDNDPARLLTPATGYEIGARFRPLKPLMLSLAAFRLDLDSEQVYVGDEGTTEPREATKRVGLEMGGRLYLNRVLFADADITLTRARYRTADEHAQTVALAPTRTLSAGIGFRLQAGAFGSLRVRHLGDRAANEDESLTAEGFTLVDAQIGYRLGPLEVGLDVQNLFNADWKEAQFATTSRLKNEPAPVEDIHFVPGYPFTILGHATAYWK